MLPYPFALAAVPVATERQVYGAVFVTWPGAHPPELSDGERDHLWAACERLALRLERSRRTSPPPGREHDVLSTPVSGGGGHTGLHRGGADGVPAAVRTGGHWILPARITFSNTAAADNRLGRPPAEMLGMLLWAAVAMAERPDVRGPLPGTA
ncbi:hypothetical protein GCM10017687_30310 [Streptomyces echinatus]|uniref:hypothetical protein n=1 Tax=Streptomyces echinatus TaxID=67293 RepID=UPI0031E7640A